MRIPIALQSFVILSATLCGTALSAPEKPAPDKPDKPPSELGAIEFRPLGPAITGRITRVTGVPGQPLVYYAAFAQGGVWKSENGGRDWKPVFDDQPTQSVGSIAVAPSGPSVL